ncbi:hypothetical protein [Rhizobium sp. BK399]|uniref:hypothetical protein n=1 Tax=Rhizobium sp. BK399 TaxID=2587063 RepID=UPI0016221F63|nr:hypothetical protein [Rhizobium sp. BK399]MBB3540802.1 hypothetical protein [Rhizobium sp. BK399]
MVKRNEIAVAETPLPVPVSLAERLDFQNAPASTVLPALSFELTKLAGAMQNVADLSVELDMRADGVSLKFRAYSRRPSLM